MLKIRINVHKNRGGFVFLLVVCFWSGFAHQIIASLKAVTRDIYLLLFMTNAAITPGIQPQQVRINTNKTEPHPLSKIAKGGKIIHNITLKIDIIRFVLKVVISMYNNVGQVSANIIKDFALRHFFCR